MLEPRCGESPQVRYLRGGRRSNAPPLPDRWSAKHDNCWLGYKLHFTETCSEAADDDPETGLPAAPNLITSVATTEASVPDVAMTAPIHDMLDAARMLPGEHAVDAGYTSADLLLAARAPGHRPARPAAGQLSPRPGPAATPPTSSPSTGNASRSPALRAPPAPWTPCTQRGTEAIVATFSAGAATRARPGPVHHHHAGAGSSPCPPVRSRSPRRRPRRAGTSQCKARYNVRAGVEGTMHQAASHRHPPRPLPRPG